MTKVTLSMIALATCVFANPMAERDTTSSTDPSGDIAALITTVSGHTANINQTLATLPSVNSTAVGTSSNANVTAEFNAISLALNSSSVPASAKRSVPLYVLSERGTDCDATCQEAVYKGIGNISSEISYTMAACILKNTVDLTNSSSVLITVAKSLGAVTEKYQGSTIASLSGVVVQNLQAGLGTDVGSALATFISPP